MQQGHLFIRAILFEQLDQPFHGCPGRKPHPPDNGPRSDLQHTQLLSFDCPPRASSECLP
jgi:hypothetical protein